MTNKLLLSMLVLLMLLLPLTNGCGNRSVEPDGKVLARINGYELTTKDFEDEIKLTAPNKELSGDPKKVKEELLDELITKKVILQEAQRQNFDKDSSFMKEIERYWEQALLKLMIRKKMEELSRAIVRDDSYNKKMQALFDDWLLNLKERADIKTYKENL